MRSSSHSPETRVSALLLKLPLFQELRKDEINRVARYARVVRALRGELLFQKGDPAPEFYVLVYGKVKLFFPSPQRQEKVVEIIEPGSSFGEAVMFLDQPHVVSARALADSLLVRVGKAGAMEELSANPEFAAGIIASLSRRLYKLVTDLEAYALGSGTHRVIGYLLRMDAAPSPTTGGFAVLLPAAKSVIASRLNLTPEYFSRVLHNLAQSGLIRIEGRGVHILDVERLRAFDL